MIITYIIEHNILVLSKLNLKQPKYIKVIKFKYNAKNPKNLNNKPKIHAYCGVSEDRGE